MHRQKEFFIEKNFLVDGLYKITIRRQLQAGFCAVTLFVTENDNAIFPGVADLQETS